MSSPSEKGISRLAYQFDTSEKFKGFLESFLAQADEIQIANTQLIEERWLDTAEGAQLDGIGDIVGIERPVGVNDSVYIWMIRAKILINNTDMYVPKQLELLSFIFDGKIVRYYNSVNLSPIYTITGVLTEEELIVFDLLPTTLGVGVAYISIPVYEETFSFDGDEGLGFSTTTAPETGGNFATIIN